MNHWISSTTSAYHSDNTVNTYRDYIEQAEHCEKSLDQ